jgi:hypothetical protein
MTTMTKIWLFDRFNGVSFISIEVYFYFSRWRSLVRAIFAKKPDFLEKVGFLNPTSLSPFA